MTTPDNDLPRRLREHAAIHEASDFNGDPEQGQWAADLRAAAAELEAARVDAERLRESCAKVCRDRAMKMEAEAQRATDAGEHAAVESLHATAWQLAVAEREILDAARGAA